MTGNQDYGEVKPPNRWPMKYDLCTEREQAVLDAAVAWAIAQKRYKDVDGPMNLDYAEDSLERAVDAYLTVRAETP
jgi:hypothetical protein